MVQQLIIYSWDNGIIDNAMIARVDNKMGFTFVCIVPFLELMLRSRIIEPLLERIVNSLQ